MRNDGGKPRRMAPMAAVACVGFLMVSGAGCASAPAPTPRSAAPTAAPVFVSDEEALAAATEAYEQYVLVADQIVREGGVDPSRISRYVSDDLATSEIESFVSLQERNLHGVGESSYSNFSLQQVLQNPSGVKVVTAYVCSDLSKTDVVDEAGESVVAPDRQDRKPYEIGFDLSDASLGTLVVSSITVWDGDGICS
ncbi:hypothetical protein [Cryobacterium sp. AP23]